MSNIFCNIVIPSLEKRLPEVLPGSQSVSLTTQSGRGNKHWQTIV